MFPPPAYHGAAIFRAVSTVGQRRPPNPRVAVIRRGNQQDSDSHSTGLRCPDVLVHLAEEQQIGALVSLHRAVLPHALCTRLGFAEGCVRRRNTMFAR